MQHAIEMDAAKVAPLVAQSEAVATLEVASNSDEEEVQVSGETIVLD